MTASILLALAALGTSSPSPTMSPRHSPEALIAQWVRQSQTPKPRVTVSLDADAPYKRGDLARVYLKSEVDAYVAVVRFDTDGRVRLLFPIDPWEDNWVRGDHQFEVLGRDKEPAFRISDYPGVGYVFAIASPDPFDFQAITRGDHWDYRAVADDGRVQGDPYVAISDLADKITPGGEYDYDVAEYYVEEHYDYPRFACYDCHSYTHWTAWNPYASYCSSFRIVIYDDWYYYPYGYYPYYPSYYPYYNPYPYGGPYPYYRPYRPGPRYVFKDRAPGQDYVSRVGYRGREGEVDRRPTRSGQDFGGRGSVPAPTMDRQRGERPGTAGSAERPSPRREVSPREPSGTDRGQVGRTPQRRPETDARPRSTEPSATSGRGGGAAAPTRRGAAPEARSPATPDASGWGRRPAAASGERRDPASIQGRTDPRRQPAGASGARAGERDGGRAQPAPTRGDRPAGKATAAPPGRASSKPSGGSSSRPSQPELRRRPR